MEHLQVSFTSEGFRLHGTLTFPSKTAGNVPAICIAHGLPYRPLRVEEKGYLDLAEGFSKRGFSTLVFNMRGTRGSDGAFGLMNWVEDISHALTFLEDTKGVDRDRMVILGFSLGAMVSTYVAAKDKRVRGLICCSGPARNHSRDTVLRLVSYARANRTLKGADDPKTGERWLKESRRLSPVKWVGMVSPRPILIVHAQDDEVAPVRNAHLLYSKAQQPKDLFLTQGGHHLRRSPLAVSIMASWALERFGERAPK